MPIGEIFRIALILATFLCSLVAGFLFSFAFVVMPGIQRLRAPEFIRAFQVMDGVIQNNQPVFVLVWLGSIIALVTATALGIGQLAGAMRLLLIFAAAVYLLGVQLPTITINIPLNNRLQALKVDALDETAQNVARKDFEARWNQSNLIRTAFASLASVLLLLLLFGL